MGRVFLLSATLLSLLLFLGTRTDQAFSSGPVGANSGDLAAYVDSFVASIPEKGSEGYRAPTLAESARLAAAFDAVEDKDLEEAASLAAPLGYDVVPYADTVTGRDYVMLVERRNPDGSWPRGWGMYVFAPEASSDLTVEVAHPIADASTEDVGVEVFRNADAEDLFVAGAHRNANAGGAADVAHEEASVFEAIHEAAVEAETVVFQPHGFSEAKHPGYGEIVVSAGTSPTSLASDGRDALSVAGFDARLYDGDSYSDLGATTNVQGESARAAGAEFLHVEAVRTLRDDSARRAIFSDTLARFLR